MSEYLFDVDLKATVRVTAESIADANLLLCEAQGVATDVRLDGMSFRTVGRITEISVQREEDVADYDFMPVEVDGVDIQRMDEPHECDECREWYDEAGGDGYCGLCPSCADKGIAPHN